MNRKLLILDVVLVAMLAYAGFQFRSMWLAAKARERAELKHNVPTAPIPHFPPAAAPSAVMATNYAEIPAKLLLDPSRNATIVVDPPKPLPPPPPPPPLPVYYGQMNLGDGTGLFAVLGINKAAPHEMIHQGEAIGEYKLLAVSRDAIDLEWNGQTFHKNLYELLDKTAPQQVEAEQPRPAEAATRPLTPPTETPKGPGAPAGTGLRACQSYDSYKVGDVVDGYRKGERPSPFGAMCYWEPVGGTGGK